MEQLKVLDNKNVFIASYFTDDKECSHPNREHTLIYICSGELEITGHGKRTILRPGDCAFMRRDNRMMLQKRVKNGVPYQSVVMKFSRKFLKEYYQTLDKRKLPEQSSRSKLSLIVLPSNRPDIKSLFKSIRPFFDSDTIIPGELLRLKMIEGLLVLFATDINLYASLFDFTDPWKIDLMEFMNDNYMNELTMEEMAVYTGRSLASFKRDFKKISELPPLKWKCNLITINHDPNPDNRSATYGKPIVIEDKVWIGISSTILPGVRIGYGSIVGAQSVVTRDVPPMTVVAGNPARIIKKIEVSK